MSKITDTIAVAKYLYNDAYLNRFVETNCYYKNDKQFLQNFGHVRSFTRLKEIEIQIKE